MIREERLKAEAWYQALRAWKTQVLTDEVPRGPRRTSSGVPTRVVWGCPVCRSIDIAEIDTNFLDVRASGTDPSPLVREIARRLRVREAVVWSHYRDHLDPHPHRPVIGEWARRRRVRLGEYLLTPIGWIPVERILVAIREAPEEVRLWLDMARYGKGRRSLLKSNGHFHNAASRATAGAMLWLANRLESTFDEVESRYG